MSDGAPLTDTMTPTAHAQPPSAPTVEPAISVRNLSRSFGDFVAVDDVTFDVAPASIFGFLGPNGSGKTTCVRMICGLLAPTSGSASLCGLDVSTHPAEIRLLYGYMSQQFSLYRDLSVAENLSFFARVYRIGRAERKARIEELIELLDLGPYVDRRAALLSGGWKQRLALGAALIHRPRVLFLDEPTAGIDPVARRALWNLLFELADSGVTIFVTTHYMDEAERCSNIGYIRDAKLLIEGTPAQLKQLDQVTRPGERWLELRCAAPTRMLALVRARPGVSDATIFGDVLHLRVNEAWSDEDALSWLADQGDSSAAIRETRPGLEDVFVTLTQREMEA